ncbi:hypothetical protein N9K73_01105 [Candidatus Poseidoniales archaeon]|nr:hypothetical protein [Candidatus Poseidoniales archaeon]
MDAMRNTSFSCACIGFPFLFEASLTYQWANLMPAISMDTT